MNDIRRTWARVRDQLQLWPGGHIVVGGDSSVGLMLDLLVELIETQVVDRVKLSCLRESKEDAALLAPILMNLNRVFTGGVDIIVSPITETVKWAKPKPNLTVAKFKGVGAGRFLHRARDETAKDGQVLILAPVAWATEWQREVHRETKSEMFVLPGGKDAWFLFDRLRQPFWHLL